MGLLGGIARTAVAAGTWTAVSNRVSRRQYDRWATQEAQQQQQQQYYQQPVQAPAPAPAANPADDRIARLKQLGELKESGILTEQEFAQEKAKILRG